MKTIAILCALLLWGVPAARAKSRPPARFMAAMNKAQAEIAANHYDQARQTAGDAVPFAVTDEQKADALDCVFGVDVSMKRVKMAQDDLRRIAAIPGRTAQQKIGFQNDLGTLFTETQQYEQARAAFAKAPTLPGADAFTRTDAQYRIASTYLSERNYPQARAAYARVLRMRDADPFFKADAQAELAETFLDAGDFAQARAEYAKVLTMPGAVDSMKSDAQQHIALCFFRAGDYADAATEYNKVLPMPGTDVDADAAVRAQLAAIAQMQQPPPPDHSLWTWLAALFQKLWARWDNQPSP